ncbi:MULTISPECIES: three-helix bundle dimerization domain-containing protein [unclassified Streptomyces]|uniref:three-helix bundle dimerization domain-containing protein n=1 Tax=unclassified Streptomyces TaxID=2593676 RepID=UPI00336A60DA
MSASPPALPDERLAAGAARLATHHAGRFAAETVQTLLADSYRRLAATARVHTHLVVLAERLTAERLDALAHVQGAPGPGLPRVLFVCSHNAGRSQLAAGSPRVPCRRSRDRLLGGDAPGGRGRAAYRTGPRRGGR